MKKHTVQPDTFEQDAFLHKLLGAFADLGRRQLVRSRVHLARERSAERRRTRCYIMVGRIRMLHLDGCVGAEAVDALDELGQVVVFALEDIEDEIVAHGVRHGVSLAELVQAAQRHKRRAVARTAPVMVHEVLGRPRLVFLMVFRRSRRHEDAILHDVTGDYDGR